MKGSYKYIQKYAIVGEIKNFYCCGCKTCGLTHYNCGAFNCPFKPRFKIKKRVLRKWSNE